MKRVSPLRKISCHMEGLLLIVALLVIVMLIAGCTSAPRPSHDHNRMHHTFVPPATVTDTCRDLQPPEVDGDVLPSTEIPAPLGANQENRLPLNITSIPDCGAGGSAPMIERGLICSLTGECKWNPCLDTGGTAPLCRRSPANWKITESDQKKSARSRIRTGELLRE